MQNNINNEKQKIKLIMKGVKDLNEENKTIENTGLTKDFNEMMRKIF